MVRLYILFYSVVEEKVFWYDGALIKSGVLELALDNPGLIYGATVFTTLRIYQQSLDSQLTNWKAHCDRLHTSLQAFGWQQPSWERVRSGAEALMLSFPVLRITIFPDGREWITGRSLPTDLTARQQQGIVAWLAAEPLFCRSLPEHKTGNYLSAWLALTKAQSFGAKEAILIDQAGNWLESSTGNLWGWRDNQWWTPSLEVGILPGVARSQLINWLNSQEQPVGEVAWTETWVRQLEAIAYTNSVIEVVPIHTVITEYGNLTYNRSHPSLKQLQSFFIVDS